MRRTSGTGSAISEVARVRNRRNERNAWPMVARSSRYNRARSRCCTDYRTGEGIMTRNTDEQRKQRVVAMQRQQKVSSLTMPCPQGWKLLMRGVYVRMPGSREGGHMPWQSVAVATPLATLKGRRWGGRKMQAGTGTNATQKASDRITSCRVQSAAKRRRCFSTALE